MLMMICLIAFGICSIAFPPSREFLLVYYSISSKSKKAKKQTGRFFLLEKTKDDGDGSRQL